MLTDEVHVDALVRLYDEQPLALDMLPYSEEFEGVYAGLRREFPHAETVQNADRRDIYLTLMNERKQGRLPRKTDRGLGQPEQ